MSKAGPGYSGSTVYQNCVTVLAFHVSCFILSAGSSCKCLLLLELSCYDIVIDFSGVFRQQRVNVWGLFSDSFDARCVIVRTLHEIVIIFNGVFRKIRVTVRGLVLINCIIMLLFYIQPIKCLSAPT